MIIDRKHLYSSAPHLDAPNFDINEYLSKTPAPNDYNLREKIEEWRENGLVIFESAVDQQTIERLLDDIDYVCKYPKKFDLEIEFRGKRHKLKEIDFNPLSDTGTKFNCLENLSLAARELSLNKFACDFLKHVFQEPPVVLQSLTFWKGSNQPAHVDYPYVRTQTKLAALAASWIPLEDIHAGSGPLAYYPGSHKPGVIKPFDWGNGSVVLEHDSARTTHEFTTHLYEQIASAGLKPKIFLPKRGDILIWHGALIHEGTKTQDPNLTRKSYVTHYTSWRAYPENHKYKNALEKGRFTKRNGGYVFDHPWVNDGRSLTSWSYDHSA